MILKLILLIGVVSTGALVAIISSTAPSSSHPVVILGVFVLIYFVALAIISLFLSGMYMVLAKLRKKSILTENADKQKLYYYASVIALAPVIFIAMQSVGKLSMYEACLIIFFEVLACVYIAKRT